MVDKPRVIKVNSQPTPDVEHSRQGSQSEELREFMVVLHRALKGVTAYIERRYQLKTK